jgi:site-specific recombinase XerD
MERELLITVKKSNYDNKKIDREIECIKTLFPYLESFETFTASNEIFDLEKHKIVSALPRLRHIFYEGMQKNNSFIVSLN